MQFQLILFLFLREAKDLYAMVHTKRSNLSPNEINTMWGQLSAKQKKKYSDEHKQMKLTYVADFENFVRVNC